MNLKHKNAIPIFATIAAAVGAITVFSPPAIAQENNQFLASVTFSKVDFIYTGELAHYTGLNQNISFKVFTNQVINEVTGLPVSNGPDAFFAIRNLAVTSDDAAGSVRYCIETIRSVAMNPAAGAQLRLFVNVTQVEGGPNFVIHTFNSCALQLPPPT